MDIWVSAAFYNLIGSREVELQSHQVLECRHDPMRVNSWIFEPFHHVIVQLVQLIVLLSPF